MALWKSQTFEHGGMILGDTEITGEITFKDLISIEGRVVGKITSESGRLVVAEKGVINGNINVGTVTISGEVHGDVFARERIDVHATGKIHGDICAPVLTVDAGAKITGRIETVAPENAAIANQRQKPGQPEGGLRAAG